MIQTRKGLSDIVTNVLIILLVLVAIGIIWAFVRPTIQEGAGQLSGTGDCLTAEVVAERCVSNGGGSYNLTYTRNPGAGNLQEVKFLLKDSNGNSVLNSTIIAANLPAALETKTVNNVFFVGLGANPSFDVAVVVKTNAPEGKLCAPHGEPVACS